MNRILYFLISFALFGGSALPASVRACIVPSVIDARPKLSPPEELTDPAAVARWTAEREAFALAYEAAETERHVRQHRMNLAAYASEVAAMDKAALAEALAVNLTPPLEAAFATRNDCDDIYGPLIFDPAGYLANDLADIAIARGVFADKRDADYIPRRWARRSMADRPFPPCVIEARTAVSAHLARRFSQTELASALSAIRLNGFDRVTTDNARAANRRPGDFRLLKFSEGRSGRLEFNTKAEPNRGQNGETVDGQLSREQFAKLAEFFQSGDVGKALIGEVEAVLSQGTALCPQATQLQDQFWKELRQVTEAEKNRVLENSP